jgi:hypothetical protein
MKVKEGPVLNARNYWTMLISNWINVNSAGKNPPVHDVLCTAINRICVTE